MRTLHVACTLYNVRYFRVSLRGLLTAYIGGAVAAAVGGTAAVVAVPVVLGAVGFTAAVGGSAAAASGGVGAAVAAVLI